jgi:hypothetical protein
MINAKIEKIVQKSCFVLVLCKTRPWTARAQIYPLMKFVFLVNFLFHFPFRRDID